ncbi:MAG: helix-turn-helix domain-containing protein, partial [Bacteroidota bacterium]
MPHATRTSEETDQHNPFLRKLREVVEANLQNDQFSVEALAEQMNMSRSSLHRKLKQMSGQTTNQFIREYRLERATELLKKDDRPISEVAYAVGFSSPSYFTSCFTEHYGYPPGEAKFRAHEAEQEIKPIEGNQFRLSTKVLALTDLLAIGLVVIIFMFQWQSASSESAVVVREQSVAVLPLKNLNVDQEYEYFSEGVVQAINRQLSQMEGLKVISLTS